jgi:hypothetical protein
MRAIAEFTMRGRMQATLVVVGSAALPLLFWLSAASGALVLLRRGLHETLGILAWALLPALVWWFLGDPSLLLILLGTLVLAQVLRATGSWVWVLLASVVVAGLFALILSATSAELIKALTDGVREVLPQLVGQGEMTAEQLAGFQDSLKPILTGIMAASMQVVCVLCLILARYWQAELYNLGGFGREFRALRLPWPVALALLSGVILGPRLAAPLAVMAPICTVPLLFAGLALGHGLIEMKRLSSFWLIGMYIAVLLLGNLVCLLAVVDGLFDFRGRLARKNGAGPANGEG